MQSTGRARGFTLIELLVVIAIIAILAAILFPVFAKARDRANQATCTSNMNQIGKAFLLYAGDNNDTIGRKFYEWHVDLDPYVKTGEVFHCPTSTAPPLEKVDYPNGYTCNDYEHTVIRGSFWTNGPKDQNPRPVIIYGNYTRNDEMIWNFGFVKGQKGAGLNLSRWKSTADIILVAEAKDGREGKNSGFTEANGPYIEPGSTNWNEVYAQLSGRHAGGQVCLFADGHVSFKKLEWFRSTEGKHAICPAQEDTSNGTAW